MDWSQALYIAALASAIGFGKPGYWISAVMAFNLAATIMLSASPEYVALVDMLSAAGLIGFDRRENTIAALFVSMVFVEVIASRLNLQNWIIYTATDVLAYIQCGVIGGADRGMGRLYRAIHRWLARVVHTVAGGNNPGLRLARNPATHRGGLNGGA